MSDRCFWLSVMGVLLLGCVFVVRGEDLKRKCQRDQFFDRIGNRGFRPDEVEVWKPPSWSVWARPCPGYEPEGWTKLYGTGWCPAGQDSDGTIHFHRESVLPPDEPVKPSPIATPPR